MQIGVSHYTQNQTMGNNLQALQQQSTEAVEKSAPATEADWLDDAVSWSDKLYELHELAEQVQVEDVGFSELSQLRQALYEKGWISPSQATALTEVSQRLSDRLTYQVDDVLSKAIDEQGAQMERLLAPVRTMVQNVQAVQQASQQSAAA